MLKLLVVEDDHHLSQTILETVQGEYEVTQVYDGEEGLFQAEQDIYDGIILDIMLPSMDGYTVLHELREKEIFTPVLILTAKDGIQNKIQGFKEGADDYLVKPFHREELLLRLSAILRRTSGQHHEQQLIFNDLTLHLKKKTAFINEQELPLNGKEFDLLLYLIHNQDMIITKEQIFDRIWGFESETSLSVVEVYMSHLRKKLKPFGYDQFIKTLRNVGYLLSGGDQT